MFTKPQLFRMYFWREHCRGFMTHNGREYYERDVAPYKKEFKKLLKFKLEAFLIGYPVTSEYVDLDLRDYYNKDVDKVSRIILDKITTVQYGRV